jgi:hypothetical protein
MPRAAEGDGTSVPPALSQQFIHGRRLTCSARVFQQAGLATEALRP